MYLYVVSSGWRPSHGWWGKVSVSRVWMQQVQPIKHLQGSCPPPWYPVPSFRHHLQVSKRKAMELPRNPAKLVFAEKEKKNLPRLDRQVEN